MAEETNISKVGPKYDLDKVYTQAFSHLRPPYPNLVQESSTVGISPVGTIRALKGVFKLRSSLNVDYTLPIRIDGWQFPQEPVIGIRGGKKVIETELNRGDRTQNVLEEVNLNNYRIRIRGIILNEDDFDAYPEEAMRRFREIVEKPGSVTIENALTTLWNINKVEIIDWDLREVQGYIGAQAFELECMSDQDFELELIDDPERL